MEIMCTLWKFVVTFMEICCTLWKFCVTFMEIYCHLWKFCVTGASAEGCDFQAFRGRSGSVGVGRGRSGNRNVLRSDPRAGIGLVRIMEIPISSYGNFP